MLCLVSYSNPVNKLVMVNDELISFFLFVCFLLINFSCTRSYLFHQNIQECEKLALLIYGFCLIIYFSKMHYSNLLLVLDVRSLTCSLEGKHTSKGRQKFRKATPPDNMKEKLLKWH